MHLTLLSQWALGFLSLHYGTSTPLNTGSHWAPVVPRILNHLVWKLQLLIPCSHPKIFLVSRSKLGPRDLQASQWLKTGDAHNRDTGLEVYGKVTHGCHTYQENWVFSVIKHTIFSNKNYKPGKRKIKCIPYHLSLLSLMTGSPTLPRWVSTAQYYTRSTSSCLFLSPFIFLLHIPCSHHSLKCLQMASIVLLDHLTNK